MAENAFERPLQRSEASGDRTHTRPLALPRVGALSWAAAIFLMGAVLRFAGIAWDETYHLHPDERFLTMVATAIRPAASLGEYFDTARSPLSPYNHNFGLYVYGTFPLYLVKAVGLLLDQSGYDQIHLVGRGLAALFDLGTIGLTMLVGRRLYGTTVGLVGGAIYALMALPIQQSHFFTVDSYATFFAVLAALFALRVGERNHLRDYLLLGLAIGVGVACKISMFVLGGFALLAAGLILYRGYEHSRTIDGHLVTAVTQRLIIAGAVSLVAFRLVQPIAFQGPSVLSLIPNEQWLANIAEIGGLQSGERDFPPGHQWTNRAPVWFPWSNMVVWGMGIPLGVAAWIGWGLATYELIRQRKLAHLFPVAFIGVVFLYQGTQWVKSMRYFLHLYPFLALTAAYLLYRLWQVRDAGWLRTVTRPAVVLVVALTGLYAMAFTSIYLRPHSRVEASRWIFDNVPRGAVLANEHWDDPLPLRVDGRDGFGGYYRGIMLNNYDEDVPKKLDDLVNGLAQADYVILSSNRLYDSIPRLPMRYPMTTRYYGLLFAEEIGFRKIAEFTSYPGLFGITLADQSAEEAWSVYDHPKVTIFQKTAEFDRAQVRAALNDGIDWDGILRLRPDQATKAPTGLLLSASDQERYQASGTWKALFNPTSWSNTLPILSWWLGIQIVGIVALPLTMVACGALIDRGYGIAKPVGLLLVAWIAWIAASVRLAEFGPALVLAALGLVALASTVTAWPRRRELRSTLQARWRLMALEEVLFTALFIGFVAVRASNPDLWHPVMGGEKPMDFAYLNAVIRSAYFPPYDPWFAGGYINYYYFGFVLVASLVHLTGVIPWIAYNVAVPSLFAATGLGAFVVALNLVQPTFSGPTRLGAHLLPVTRAAVTSGLAAVVGVTIIGNLGELRLLLNGLHDLGRTASRLSTPFFGDALRVVDGLREVVVNGRTLPFRTEWWYWNATRVIAHPQGEAVPITEFPYFSFLYGDLHAHMMALPFTLVVLALAVSIVRSSSVPRFVAGRVLQAGFPLAGTGLMALMIGALWPLNTWDFPSFGLLAGAAFVWRSIAVSRGSVLPSLLRAGAQWLSLMVLAYVAFLPFHRAYAAGYSSAELWKGSRTTLDAYLVIHGIVLFVIVTALVVKVASRRTRAPLARDLRLLLGQSYRPTRLHQLTQRFIHRSARQRAGLGLLSATFVLALGLAALGSGAIALPLVLIVLSLVLLADPQIEARERLTLTLVAAGAGLTMLVELVVLKGDISRMNTVFKFYLQVWTFWSIAAAVLLPALLGVRGAVRGDAPESVGTPNLSTPAWWRPAFGVLVVSGLLYPIFATYVRAHDRFEGSDAVTLNGMTYMDTAVYNDRNQAIALRWDRDAIQWMLATLEGSPVIVEAVTPLYRWGSRVSVYTGLPTIIGWDWHQKQQRAVLPGEVVDRRINDVSQIFGSASPERTGELLERYSVRYIYVGQLERLYYPGVETKMRRLEGTLWNRVYENQEVAIYEVRQS